MGRWRDWTPIAALLQDTADRAAGRLLELAETLRWRWVALANTSGTLYPGIELRGALVDRLPSDSKVRQLLGMGIPVVRIGVWPHPEDYLVPAVVPDRVAAAHMAADHLAQRGFEHVAFIGRNPWAANQDMFEAFLSSSLRLGCQCHLLQEDVEQLRSQMPADGNLLMLRQTAFAAWLERTPKPLGLFTFGDPAAALYCQWVVEAGLRVPEDVAVLGIGDTRFVCESAAVPLSSVAFDHLAIVQTAVGMLARLIAGESLERTTVMVPPVGIVPRQSTDVVAASEPAVVRALRFMWDHVTQRLSVDEIAGHVGVSRRTLEKLFKREIGRGVGQEYKRRRLDKASQLLRMTDMPITDISDGLGFSYPSAFCKAFRTAFGVSPTDHRLGRGQASPTGRVTSMDSD